MDRIHNQSAQLYLTVGLVRAPSPSLVIKAVPASSQKLKLCNHDFLSSIQHREYHQVLKILLGSRRSISDLSRSCPSVPQSGSSPTIPCVSPFPPTLPLPQLYLFNLNQCRATLF